MKYIPGIFILLFCFLYFGCGTMMVLLGDNIRYVISGNVKNANDKKNISHVKVSVNCSGLEKTMYQNREGITDNSGEYKLVGYWELNGCKIIFEHVNYEPRSIIIDDSHLVSAEGLSRDYKVDVRLNPKDQN
jgi:hypothetical protein